MGDVQEALKMHFPYEKEKEYSEIKYKFERFTYVYGNTVRFMRCHEYKTLDELDNPCAKKEYFEDSVECKEYVDNNIEKLLSEKRTRTEKGCYIATCVYGSYDCPQVWTLRRFCDFILDERWYGKVFIKSYYAISPTIVKAFGNCKWFKSFCKNRLDTIVTNLNRNGIGNTRYDDKY